MDMSLLTGGCVALVLVIMNETLSDKDGNILVGWLLIITAIVLISIAF